MKSSYVTPPNSDGSDNLTTYSPRATELGCTIQFGDSTGLVTVLPSILVTSTAIAPVVIADDQGQASLVAVQAAQSAATTAETTAASGIAQAETNLATLLSGLSTTVTQANSDLVTLAASTDPLAPIISRNVEGSLALAQGLADTLVVLKIIAASEVPSGAS